MDDTPEKLYFSVMRPGPAAPARAPARPASPVPAFFLYGEPLQPPDERLVHIETIAARSRLHDWVIRPHRHRDLHQLLLIRRGRVDARLDGRTESLRGPSAIVVPPGAVHSFSFQPETAGVVVSFASALAAELCAASPGAVELLQRAACVSLHRGALRETDLLPLAGMLLREFGRSAPGRRAALRGLLGALLANIQRLVQESAATAAVSSRDQELTARFREQVERGFREHISVADYAARLQITETRLRRACYAAAGQSPIDLVHLRVLVEAERQLRYTSMSVTQVGYYLGFEDPAYFSRFFTRQAGMSPREFRSRETPIRALGRQSSGVATEPRDSSRTL